MFKKKSKITQKYNQEDFNTAYQGNLTIPSLATISPEEVSISDNLQDIKNKNNKFGNFRLTSKMKLIPLTIASGFFLLSSMSVFIYQSVSTQKTRQSVSYISQLDQNIERLEKNSLYIQASKFEAFPEIEKSIKSIDLILKVLENGGQYEETDKEIGPILSEVEDSFKITKSKWETNRNVIQKLLKEKSSLISIKDSLISSNKEFQTVLEKTLLVQQENSGAKNIQPIINEFLVLLNKTNSSSKEILSNDFFNSDNGSSLIKDLNSLNTLFSTIKSTVPISTSLEDLEKSLKGYTELSDKLKDNSELINNAKEVSKNISSATITLKSSISDLNKLYLAHIKSLSYYTYISLSLFVLFLIGVYFIILISYQRTLKYSKMVYALNKNQNNKKVANELLEQMNPLDNGDFTKSIVVTDKFLSGIGTRIDKIRIQFGEIVKQIKQNSSQILSAAKITESTSKDLLNISNQQFQQLSLSIKSINSITNSMDEIAQSAWIAQEESNKSVEESKKGQLLVNQSINKMTEIRNTIQESSKKIKKLGESAQSISEVTGLIKQITKKINILALNAAIQAASSGESGREFTVVAQEVQKLADDSETATKKIESLINDIQTDTAKAIASMETTTQEVIVGAQLTEKAGKALKDINELSQTTSSQIKDASTKLEEKSVDMAKLTITMESLQKITEQSKKSVQVTSTQVDELKRISEELRETISQFKV